MSEKHTDAMEMSVAALTGRVLGNDALLRKMLGQIIVLQAIVSERRDFSASKEMLRSWLDELTAQISATIIEHEDAETIRRHAIQSLHLNIGDILQAIDEDTRDYRP